VLAVDVETDEDRPGLETDDRTDESEDDDDVGRPVGLGCGVVVDIRLDG